MLFENNTNYVFCSESNNSGDGDSSLSYGAIVDSYDAAAVGSGANAADGFV